LAGLGAQHPHLYPHPNPPQRGGRNSVAGTACPHPALRDPPLRIPRGHAQFKGFKWGFAPRGGRPILGGSKGASPRGGQAHFRGFKGGFAPLAGLGAQHPLTKFFSLPFRGGLGWGFNSGCNASTTLGGSPLEPPIQKQPPSLSLNPTIGASLKL